MRVSSPANLMSIQHFMQGGAATHFTLNKDKSVDIFNQNPCDHCKKLVRDANVITFTNVRLPGLFVIAGLEPSECTEEVSMTEDGEGVCEACYNNIEAEA